MRQNLPNQDPSKYAEEGYCVFYDCLSIDEMKTYQQTLDGMIDRMRPGEKPQFMFEPHVGSRHWRTWLGLARNPKVLDAVGYDTEKYTGFAFGMGPERISMLHRLLFSGSA